MACCSCSWISNFCHGRNKVSSLYVNPNRISSSIQLNLLPRSYSRLHAYRRTPTYPQEESSWGRKQGLTMEELGDDDLDDEDDDEDDEDEDRSLDLLVRFVQNVFKKISKRARKAVRSVLPVPISARLVGFAVNGVIVLAFLWVLKAFLEVVCTLGSVVFVSILLIRGVWAGVSYLQENRRYKMDEFENEDRPWNGAQPA